jgi:hypothetical protein
VEFIVISDAHILSYYAKRILDFFRLSHMQAIGTRVTSVEFIVISDTHILSYYAKRILDFFRLSHMQAIGTHVTSVEFIVISDMPTCLKEKGTHFTKIKQTSIVFFIAVQNFPSSFCCKWEPYLFY